MILILADSGDAWSTLIHLELSRRGKEVSWVQPSQLLDRILLNWSVRCDGAVPEGTLIVEERPVALADLTGVLVRLPIPPPLSIDDLSPEDRSYVTRETTAAWLALLDTLPCAVINRPVPGGRATLMSGSAEYSRLARVHGFLMPPSYYAASWADAVAKFASWHNRVYVKMLGSSEPGRFLNEPGDANSEPFPQHRSVFLQPVPDGQRITVYVVAGEAVATLVHPVGSSNEPQIVPAVPADACLRLTQDLGLAFAECEVILAADGIYCLDVSASPRYWRCPQEVQQRIVASLSDCLSQQRSHSLHDSLIGANG